MHLALRVMHDEYPLFSIVVSWLLVFQTFRLHVWHQSDAMQSLLRPAAVAVGTGVHPLGSPICRVLKTLPKDETRDKHDF